MGLTLMVNNVKNIFLPGITNVYFICILGFHILFATIPSNNELELNQLTTQCNNLQLNGIFYLTRMILENKFRIFISRKSRLLRFRNL